MVELRDNISELCEIMDTKFVNDLKKGMKIAADEGWSTEELYQKDIIRLDRVNNICRNMEEERELQKLEKEYLF